MSAWSGVKKVLRTVAPFLGSLIAGPLGGSAAKGLSELLLGKPDGSEKEIERALYNATPQQFIELKKLDLKFKKDMAEIGVTELEIAAMDRDSARKREMTVKDHIPGTLAIFLTLGFFAALVGFAMVPIQPGAKGLLDTMIGSLGTVWIMAMAYYFGSSIGSARKTEIMGESR